jgi:hypothetical protein
MRRLAAVAFAIVAITTPGAAQQRALPDWQAFFSATEQNLLTSQREQRHYAYRERRSDLHINPFGKIGTGGTRVYDVVPDATPGVVLRTLVERDGKPVTDGKPERIEPRGRERLNGSRNPIDAALAVLDLAMEGRDVIDGRPMIRVAFEPKRDAKPTSRIQKLATQFKGHAWVDESAREVARVDAVAVDDLTFGLGLLARLNEGTRVTLTREPVDGATWLPTSIHFTGQGRAMLFRKLVVNYGVEWFDYRRTK